MSKWKKSNTAFTLVELSIVLVILGLLVGGVLAGQSLIRAAELRSVTTEASRYITAVLSFKDKCFALPGDMANAQTFWSSAAACPGTASQGSTDKTTCNGNGDGLLVPAGAGFGNENYRFWQHLANAGLIEGSYSGVTGDDSYVYTSISANVPKSKAGNAYWSIIASSTYPTNTIFRYSGNHLILGGLISLSWNYGKILSAEEMWNVDTKADDGKPALGAIITNVTVCTDAADSTSASFNANYVLTATGKNCQPVYVRPF